MNQHDPKSEPCESADALRTAYALGELNDAARLKALRGWESDPAAKQDAESLAEIAHWLKRTAAAAFPSSAEPSTVRAAVEAKLSEQASPVMAAAVPAWFGRLAASRRRSLAYGLAGAACLALLAMGLSLAMHNGGNGVPSQDSNVVATDSSNADVGPADSAAGQLADNPSPSASTQAGAGTTAPPRDSKSPPAPLNGIATDHSPGAVPASKSASAPPYGPRVPGAAGPDGVSADPAMQELLSSRRLRGQLLREVQASIDRARLPSGNNNSPPGLIGNIPPEAPHADKKDPRSEAARRIVVEFPFAPASGGKSVAFPLSLHGDSYDRVKDALRRGELPPPNEVWPEEFVNDFSYEATAVQGTPLGVVLESAACPWNAKNLLVRATLRAAGASGGDARASLAATAARRFEVTIQFDPKTVAQYRLIACAAMADAEASAAIAPSRLQGLAPGRTVTALYELTLHGLATLSDLDDPAVRTKPRRAAEVSSAQRRLLSLHWTCDGCAGTQPASAVHVHNESGKRFAEASNDFRFAAAAAAFAMLLRNPPHRGAPAPAPVLSLDLEKLAAMAAAATGPDLDGRRADMLALIHEAQRLNDRQAKSTQAP